MFGEKEASRAVLSLVCPLGDPTSPLLSEPRQPGRRKDETIVQDRWVWVPFEVDKKFDGYRIDRVLARRLAGVLRGKLQAMLADPRVLKETKPTKANSKVHTGEKIQIAYLRRPEKPLTEAASIPVI